MCQCECLIRGAEASGCREERKGGGRRKGRVMDRRKTGMSRREGAEKGRVDGIEFN